MMHTQLDLFERYLQAIRKHLPWGRQDDILAELRANLESQLEDKQEELGRPLTEGEMIDWLKQLGSPMNVASRYRPQQYLIGPAIFPMYWYVIRLAVPLTATIYTVVNGLLIGLQTSGAPSIGEAISKLPSVLIMVAAWVTAVFVGFEFVINHCPNVHLPIAGWSRNWNPGDLPPLEQAPPKGHKPKTYAQAVAEVIFGFLFLVWLTLIPHHPSMLMGPGAAALHASPFRLAHVWWDFYRLVVIVNFLQVGWNSYRLWDGTWQEPSLALQLASKVMGIVTLGVLIAAPNHAYLLLRNPATDAMQYGTMLDTINLWAWRGVSIMALIVVLQLIGDSIKAGIAAYRRHMSVN